MLKILARRHGFLVGMASGAVAWGAQHYLSECNKNDFPVMFFGDSGRAYLTKDVY
jgi:cysteine synthase